MEENQAVEAQQEAHQEASEAPQYESEARAQGWVAKEEFRGSEDDWVDAETFVRRGKEIMPILRKNNEKLLKELDAAKKAAEEAREAAKEFREFQKQQFERKTKDLEAQLEQLKQAKREAITQGDGDRAIAIDDAMDDLKEQRQEAKDELKAAEEKVKEVPQITTDPTLNAWMDKNDWFGKDTRLTGIANGLGVELRRENPALNGQAFLDKLDEELATYLPEKFGKKRVQNPMEGSPNGTARPTVGGAKKSYNNLPADAKAACDKFVKQGLMTKEQYVAEYDWN
jgi:DNA repair exonuclease SbcCD ATPase subunit